MAYWTPHEADLYFSPWVMRSAWNKTLKWYATGEWVDPAEMLAWKADPWRHLADLAVDLESGAYKPSVFPEIPYPKKGGFTRHYLAPSLRDQVAFNVFLVLLGPFLEARMPNVSFGNRLYRRRVLRYSREENNQRTATKRWYQTPFSLTDDRVYLGFPSSYGLFRRVLQWLANLCVLGSTGTAEATEWSIEDPDRLPYLDAIRRRALKTEPVYARLDLRMTYPTVDRDILADVMTSLLRNPGTEGAARVYPDGCLQSPMGRPSFPYMRDQEACFVSWIEPYRKHGVQHPWKALARLSAEDARLGLCAQLCNAIKGITYAPWETSRGWNDSVNTMWPCGECDAEQLKYCCTVADDNGLWLGPLGYAPLSPELEEPLIAPRLGLPTGLAASGFLLNVAMTPVDEAMVRLWDEAYTENGFFVYLRFVDDVVMLADSAERLEEGIQVFESEIKDSVGPNVRLNLKKAAPGGVKAFLMEKYGPEQNGDSGQGIRERAEGNMLKSYLTPQDYLTRANLQMFTTTVVREMSDLGEEALDERYGAAGVERLERLMELATMEVDDFEVGADARLSFAVNRMASASWPDGDVVCDGRVVPRAEFVHKILLIAETALRRHPWRYKLWRPILRIAMRASIEGAMALAEESTTGEASEEAGRPTRMVGLDWLCKSVLPLISWSQADEPAISARSWECLDADAHVAVEGSPCQRSEDLEEAVVHRLRERCRFQRAEFLRQLAQNLDALQRIANSDSGVPGFGLAAHFTQREAQAVLVHFSDLPRLFRRLYGSWTWRWKEPPFLWWWEMEALSVLIMKAEGLPDHLMESLKSPQALTLRTKGGLGEKVVRGALRRYGLVKPTSKRPFMVKGYQGMAIATAAVDDIPPSAWFSVLCQSDESWCAMEGLFPRLEESGWAALARLSLWPSHHDLIVSSEAPIYAPPYEELPSSYSGLWRDYITLMDYWALRRLLLAHGMHVTIGQFPKWFPSARVRAESPLQPENLQRAMYGLGDRSSECSCPDPNTAPAIGLNYLVARQIWHRIRRIVKGGSCRKLVCPSTVILHQEAYRQVTEIRDSCLVRGNERYFVKPKVKGEVVATVDDLSLEHPAPHPIFMLSKRLCGGDLDTLVQYRLAALMLWMIEGGEGLITGVLSAFPWQVPFTERHAVRTRYAIPQHLWYKIERHLGVSSSWASQSAETTKLTDHDFWLTRIFMSGDGDWTVGETKGTEDLMHPLDEIFVRIVQPAESVDSGKWLARSDRPYLVESKETMGRVPMEVAARLHESLSSSRIAGFSNGVSVIGKARGGEAPGPVRDHIVMFPEWYCDQATARGFRQFCRETGIAVLCGMLPRELPRAVPVVDAVRREGLRCVVNEAILVMPGYETRGRTQGFRLPTAVHQFYIRKCAPSVGEVSLMGHLQNAVPDTEWCFVGGDRWFELTHPSWGAFCVTLCSDVLTAGKWRDLACQIQHLFIPARNPDVELFDQLMWVAGYRLFANAVTVNHGKYGGTAVWTPRHGYGREVFRVRGRNKGVSAVVGIPVRSLMVAQEKQYLRSLRDSRREWRDAANKAAGHGDKEKKARQKPRTRLQQEYKTPPPRVRHRDPDENGSY